MGYLEDQGVAVRQGTHAVHGLGFYANKYGLKREDFPLSIEAELLSVTLPLFVELSESDQDYVVEHLDRGYRELT
jgi:dTDP-4-amino-4,6-dideoxygalactose transaminase